MGGYIVGHWRHLRLVETFFYRQKGAKPYLFPDAVTIMDEKVQNYNLTLSFTVQCTDRKAMSHI